MDNNAKYKKCPYCGLNYIELEDICCEVCYLQNPDARKAVQLKKNSQKKPQKVEKDSEQEQPCSEKENNAKKVLLELMKGKGFIGFLRTENFDNFIKIYKSGFLKSRQRVLKEKLNFTDNADPDVIAETSDFIKKHVRFYFRYKTPTNYGAYYRFGQKNPVMMVFDENLIYDKKAVFCDGNAMSSLTTTTNYANSALKDFFWDEIFGFGAFNFDNFIEKNHRNAEFLLPDQVSIEHVKEIYFKYQEDLNKAIELLGDDKRFKCNPDLFF